MGDLQKKPSDRAWKNVCPLLAAFVLLWCAVLAAPAFAADRDAPGLSGEDQETYAALASGKKVMQPRTYAVPERPTVYLTFDDGPSKLTPQVLDILKEEGVKATFFELGDEVKEFPDAAKRVVKEGHALGNHSYDHVYSSLYGSFDEFWRQVQATDNLFAATVGFRPRLLRAPGGTAGNFDAFYFYLLDQAGYTVFDWTIDSGDSKRANVPAREIVDTVKQGPFTHEVTVLMHDGSGHAETVKALPEIIKLFKDKGYAFASLSERVKPAQFGLTKPKWPRAMPPGQFGKLAAETRSFAAARHAEDVKPAPPPPDNDVPLQLRFGRAKATLPPGGYELKRGSLYVPLRLLAERLGAAVAWDERTRTATVRTGLRELHYDMGAGTVRTFVAGMPEKRYPFADIKLADGSIIVPLRVTLDLLGSGVGDYSMLKADRYVDIPPRFGAFPVFFSYSSSNDV
jgi:peptidoglycan/xylan/chitin deacetylase (PgdA/CDA1 family)